MMMRPDIPLSRLWSGSDRQIWLSRRRAGPVLKPSQTVDDQLFYNIIGVSSHIITTDQMFNMCFLTEPTSMRPVSSNPCRQQHAPDNINSTYRIPNCKDGVANEAIPYESLFFGETRSFPVQMYTSHDPFSELSVS